jgi:hypothetical protein
MNRLEGRGQQVDERSNAGIHVCKFIYFVFERNKRSVECGNLLPPLTTEFIPSKT